MASMSRTRRTRWSILRICIFAIPYHDCYEDLVPESLRRRPRAGVLRRGAREDPGDRPPGHGSAPAQHAQGPLWRAHAGRVRDLSLRRVFARANHSRQWVARAGRGVRRVRAELGAGPGDRGGALTPRYPGGRLRRGGDALRVPPRQPLRHHRFRRALRPDARPAREAARPIGACPAHLADGAHHLRRRGEGPARRHGDRGVLYAHSEKGHRARRRGDHPGPALSQRGHRARRRNAHRRRADRRRARRSREDGGGNGGLQEARHHRYPPRVHACAATQGCARARGQVPREKLMQRLFAAFALIVATGALAQPYPSKPIRVVVPFPPGGGTDIVARTVTPKMAEILGQPFIVENRAGAGGNIGTDAVAKSPADGYTLLVASASSAINTTLVPNLSWDLARDFAPVVLMVVNNHLLAAHPSVPANNVKELLALARAKPGSITYASYGPGSSAHVTAELFKLMAHVDLLHVPYKGAAPAVNDLLGGQVNIIFADVAALLPHLKSGKLKALGIGSTKRFEGLPDVPTIAESGVPGFEAGGFLGLVAPAGTPPAVINALNAAAQKSLAMPEVRERLLALASPPVGGTPEEFAAHMRREVDKWARVIRAAHIKPE